MRPNELLHVHHVGEGRGARESAYDYVCFNMDYIQSKMSEKIYTLNYVYIHPYICFTHWYSFHELLLLSIF